MPRIQGLFEANALNGTAIIKAAPGYVFSLSVSWKGLTIGDIVFQLIDNTTDNGDPSKTVLTIFANSASGQWQKEWSQGKEFVTGIIYKEGPTGAGAGQTLAELTAK
jgi:hypothetical protein